MIIFSNFVLNDNIQIQFSDNFLWCIFKGNGYTWQYLRYILNFKRLPFYLSVHSAYLEIGPASKGSKFFPIRVNLYLQERQNIFDVIVACIASVASPLNDKLRNHYMHERHDKTFKIMNAVNKGSDQAS